MNENTAQNNLDSEVGLIVCSIHPMAEFSATSPFRVEGTSLILTNSEGEINIRTSVFGDEKRFFQLDEETLSLLKDTNPDLEITEYEPGTLDWTMARVSLGVTALEEEDGDVISQPEWEAELRAYQNHVISTIDPTQVTWKELVAITKEVYTRCGDDGLLNWLRITRIYDEETVIKYMLENITDIRAIQLFLHSLTNVTPTELFIRYMETYCVDDEADMPDTELRNRDYLFNKWACDYMCAIPLDGWQVLMYADDHDEVELMCRALSFCYFDPSRKPNAEYFDLNEALDLISADATWWDLIGLWAGCPKLVKNNSDLVTRCRDIPTDEEQLPHTLFCINSILYQILGNIPATLEFIEITGGHELVIKTIDKFNEQQREYIMNQGIDPDKLIEEIEKVKQEIL